MLDVGCRMLDVGCRILDVGCRMLDVGIELYPFQSNPILSFTIQPYPILSCKKVKMSFKEMENSQLV